MNLLSNRSLEFIQLRAFLRLIQDRSSPILPSIFRQPQPAPRRSAASLRLSCVLPFVQMLEITACVQALALGGVKISQLESAGVRCLLYNHCSRFLQTGWRALAQHWRDDGEL